MVNGGVVLGGGGAVLYKYIDYGPGPVTQYIEWGPGPVTQNIQWGPGISRPCGGPGVAGRHTLALVHPLYIHWL